MQLDSQVHASGPLIKGRAESFFICGFRALLFGCQNEDSTLTDYALDAFCRELGSQKGAVAVNTVWQYASVCCALSRKPLYLRPFCCQHLSNDEILAMGFAISIQNEDHIHAKKYANTFFGKAALFAAEQSAFRLATDFLSIGLKFGPVPTTTEVAPAIEQSTEHNTFH